MAFGRGQIWPSESGAAADPTATYTLSNRVLEVRNEAALFCRVAVAGDGCRAIQILVEARTDGSNWRTIQRKTILGAEIGEYQTTLRVPEASFARISARRWGGSANTTLAIHAEARPVENGLGFLGIDGQPLELAPHQVDGVECWSDGSGGVDGLPAAPSAWAAAPSAAADQLWIPTGEADTLVIEALISGANDDWVQIQVMESPDDTTTSAEYPAVNTVIGGVIDTDFATDQFSGTAGTYYTREIPVRPGAAILVLAQRAGTKAASMLAHARLYKLGRN